MTNRLWRLAVCTSLALLSAGFAGCQSDLEKAEERLRDAQREVRQAKRALQDENEAIARRALRGEQRPWLERNLVPDLTDSEALRSLAGWVQAAEAEEHRALRAVLALRERPTTVPTPTAGMAPRSTETGHKDVADPTALPSTAEVEALRAAAPKEFAVWTTMRASPNLVRWRAAVLVAWQRVKQAAPEEYAVWRAARQDGYPDEFRDAEEEYYADLAADSREERPEVRAAIETVRARVSPHDFGAWRISRASDPADAKPSRLEEAAWRYAAAVMDLEEAAPMEWAAFDAAERARGRDPISLRPLQTPGK